MIPDILHGLNFIGSVTPVSDEIQSVQDTADDKSHDISDDSGNALDDNSDYSKIIENSHEDESIAIDTDTPDDRTIDITSEDTFDISDIMISAVSIS